MAAVFFELSGSPTKTLAAWVDDSGNLRLRDVANPGAGSLGFTLTQLLSGALPPATEEGQVLFSCDGVTFEIEKPVVGDLDSWLHDDAGILIVEGE
jgi:hypothetical protein